MINNDKLMKVLEEEKEDLFDHMKPKDGWKDPIALCSVSIDGEISIIEITNGKEVNPSNLEFIMEDWNDLKGEIESDQEPGVYYFTLKSWSTVDYWGEYDCGVDYINPVRVCLTSENNK